MPPIDYTYPVKSARMTAVRDALNGGSLALMTQEGSTVGVMSLDKLSGNVLSGLLLLNGFPKFCVATINGKLARAELRNARQELVASGLTIGDSKDAADLIVNTLDVEAGNLIKIDAAELRHA